MTALVRPLLLATLATICALNAMGSNRSELSLDEVCAYDSYYCTKLRHKPDGSIARPEPEILKILKELSSEIHAAAKTFDVDPVVIAATILAENTMNVNVADSVQNWLVANSVLPKGTLFGKAFSLGLGQINIKAALNAEPLAARIEKRPSLPDGQILDRLITPQGSISYNAAIQRLAIDAYKEIGVEISNRPAIVATLYNLGAIQDRAKRLAAAREQAKMGQKPLPDAKPNYFGYFVGHYYDLVAETIGTEKEAEKRAKERNLIPTVPNPIDLIRSPPLCDAEKGSAPENKHAASGQGAYKTLARTIDCDMTPFTLAEFQNGVVGWILSEKLERATQKSASASFPSCQAKPLHGECSAIRAIPGAQIQGSTTFVPLNAQRSSRRIREHIYLNQPLMGAFTNPLREEILKIGKELERKLSAPPASHAPKVPLAELRKWLEKLENCKPFCKTSGMTPEKIAFMIASINHYSLPPAERISTFLAQSSFESSDIPEIYSEKANDLQNTCKPLFEHAEKLFRNNIHMTAMEIRSSLHALPKLFSEGSSEPIMKSKYKSMVDRLFEEARLECASFAACQNGKLTEPVSGAQCGLERNIQNLDFLCEFGSAGAMRRVRDKVYQLNCLSPSPEFEKFCDSDIEDFFETVQHLAKLPCVKRIVVPERYITDEMFPSQDATFKSKVVFGQILIGRYSVHFEEECTATK